MEVAIINKTKIDTKELKLCRSEDVVKLQEVNEIRNAIREHLLFVGLDNRNNVRNVSLLGIGTSFNLSINAKEIIRHALITASEKVVLVHNHPSNNLEASKEDLHITAITNRLLEMYGIKLVDHIIVTEKEYLSMGKTMQLDYEKNTKEIDRMDKVMLIEENNALKSKIQELKEKDKQNTFVENNFEELDYGEC